MYCRHNAVLNFPDDKKIDEVVIHPAENANDYVVIPVQRYMPSIFDPVIQRNAFFGLSENLQLAMAADETRHIYIYA